jgi:hypothetical protein
MIGGVGRSSSTVIGQRRGATITAATRRADVHGMSSRRI